MNYIDPALRAKLYEAAFIPEHWVNVLNEMCAAVSADAGYLYSVGQHCAVYSEQRLLPPHQDRIHWGTNFHSWLRNNAPDAHYERFLVKKEYAGNAPEHFNKYRELCQKFSVGDGISTIIAPPIGNMVVCGFDRHVRNGSFAKPEADLLNSFYADLVQSAFIAARLRLQQHNSVLEVMEGLGTPCVSIDPRRRIQTMNKQFETRFGNLFSGAWNQLNLGSANEQLEATLSNIEADQDYAPGSFGLRDQQDAPIVLHFVPIRRAAHDIFTSASCFVFITEMNGNGIGPEPELLKALFGLTNKEAQLSSELTAGYSLQQAAANLDISFGTARAYLLRIFQKTGTAQQSQLVGLLSKASPLFVKASEIAG